MNSSERSTIELKGDITEKDFSNLPDNFNGNIIVEGNVNFSENCYLPCNLFLKGALGCAELKVDGDLKVEGSINFKKIHVTKDFSFKENDYPDSDGFRGDIIVDGDCDYIGESLFDTLTVAGTLDLKETKLVNDKRVVWREIKGTSIKINRTEI